MSSFDFSKLFGRQDIKKADFVAKLDAMADLAPEVRANAIEVFNSFASEDDIADVLSISEQTKAKETFQSLDIDKSSSLDDTELQGKMPFGDTQQNIEDLSTFTGSVIALNAGNYYNENGDDSIDIIDTYNEAGDIVKTTTYNINENREYFEKEELNISDNITTKYNRTDTNNDGSLEDEEWLELKDLTETEVVEDNASDKGSTTVVSAEAYLSTTNALYKDLTGQEITGMDLPVGCAIVAENKVEFNGKTYTLTDGKFVDENNNKLVDAINSSKSSDTTQSYRNRGDAINNNAKFENGKISNKPENGVSQAQTFASMLMNNAEGSTLTLGQQKETEKSAAEIILDTIDTSADKDGISLQELMTYLNAVQSEAQSASTSGDRRLSKTVDLDAKDITTITKLFNENATDGKLDKAGVEKLLKAIGTKLPTPPKPTSPVAPAPKQETKPKKEIPTIQSSGIEQIGHDVVIKNDDVEIERKGNDVRVQSNGVTVEKTDGVVSIEVNKGIDSKERITPEKTIVKTDDVKIKIGKEKIKVKDDDSKTKTDFDSVKIKNINGKIKASLDEATVNGEDDKKIIKVATRGKDSYYLAKPAEDEQNAFVAGERLIVTKRKGKNSYITESQHKIDMAKKLGVDASTNFNESQITAEYKRNGEMKFFIAGKSASIKEVQNKLEKELKNLQKA